ncbi:hypothetical protein DL240_11810 [Lujinxingia litoralis]|uniref:Ig-like domain-containing protein n=1 Tax=Lujinxingia litoralis TaxID=2211119 RepID=A0A328C851_9DELT|nr:hypothetical protein [Lujinxingia litoralis]RAL21536.1 hypothetical protein DL240_11810 [Lujinxingia litoralis]
MTTLKNRVGLMALMLAGGLCLAACGETDAPVECEGAECEQNDNQDQGIEVAGEWATNFGYDETITEETWGMMLLTEYDNEADFAITQNTSDAEFGADRYNVVVWTPVVDDSFYYCMVAFDLETVEDARAIDRSADADASDPENGGCGGFAWTKMTRK